MADTDSAHEALERLEWDDARRGVDDSPQSRMWQFTRRAALTGGAAGTAAFLLDACGGGTKSSSASSGGIFGSSKSYKFTFVNHVTTNTFFTPTQNGAADACKLLGCSYQWTGSATSNVAEMVNAVNTAITGGVDGIAVALIDPTAFNAPVASALSKGIPVVAYNADAPKNPRLAYIGQDLLKSGQQMGQHILSLVGSGDVWIFIDTPGSANLQPRVDGALQTLKGSPVTAHVVATGAAQSQQLSVIDSYIVGHPSYKGFFAVGGDTTAATAQTIQKHGLAAKGVKGGGYDLTPVTEQLLAANQIQFTIDQQPYLQGFIPILELYLDQVSQKLVGIADVDTGLKFLDKDSIKPYSSTKSRYEGTATGAGVSKA
jgi:simple sugar transport system substrate-binding protein